MVEIKVLSDEEYDAFRNKQKREKFLHELEKMSKPSPSSSRSSSFSIKNVSEPPKKKQEEPNLSIAAMDTDSGIQSLNVTTEDWSEFMTELSGGATMSPVDYITDERITGFQLDDDVIDGTDKYSKVFRKEISMLSEVLKDVKSHGIRVNALISKMMPTGKGAGNRSVGVSKGVSDLVEAYNSINTSKVQIIKAMSDLKAKQVDWQMKDKASNPSESESVDSIADRYYKQIINGGTKNFVQQSMARYGGINSGFEYDPVTDNDDELAERQLMEAEGDPSEIDSMVVGGLGFNPTQPLRGMGQFGGNFVNGDPFGNIAHEREAVDICVYEYGDGNYQFVALNDDGEPVQGVELPSDEDPSILASLTIRPGSEYVYDRYNRKYRIIQMDGGGYDESDYPFGSDDEKYDDD